MTVDHLTPILNRVAEASPLDRARGVLLSGRMENVVKKLKKAHSKEFIIRDCFEHGSTLRGTAVASDVDDLDLIVELDPEALRLLAPDVCLKHFHRLLNRQWKGSLAGRTIKTQLQSHSVGLLWEPKHRIDVVPVIPGSKAGEYLVPEVARGPGLKNIPPAWVPTYPRSFYLRFSDLATSCPALRPSVRLLKMWKRAARKGGDAPPPTPSSYAIEIWCMEQCERHPDVAVADLILRFWSHFSQVCDSPAGLPVLIDPWTQREIVRAPRGYRGGDPFAPFREDCEASASRFAAIMNGDTSNDALRAVSALFQGSDWEKLTDFRAGRVLQSDPLLPVDDDPGEWLQGSRGTMFAEPEDLGPHDPRDNPPPWSREDK